ncbi:hypothetical protein P4597_04120 [Peribacillus simplex]|nr:hypothetical protein [Peribacillus simplex]MED3908374.1 hypothetical protein [Peribacillus simplex]
MREANVFNSGQTVLGMFGQDLSYYMDRNIARVTVLTGIPHGHVVN